MKFDNKPPEISDPVEGEKRIIKVRAESFVKKVNNRLPIEERSTGDPVQITQQFMQIYFDSIDESDEEDFANRCGRAVNDFFRSHLSKIDWIIEGYSLNRSLDGSVAKIEIDDIINIVASRVSQVVGSESIEPVINPANINANGDSIGFLELFIPKVPTFENRNATEKRKDIYSPETVVILGEKALQPKLHKANFLSYQNAAALMRQKFASDRPDINIEAVFGGINYKPKDIEDARIFMQDIFVNLVSTGRLPRLKPVQQKILGLFFGVRMHKGSDGKAYPVRAVGVQIKELRKILKESNGFNLDQSNRAIVGSIIAMCGISNNSSTD